MYKSQHHNELFSDFPLGNIQYEPRIDNVLARTNSNMVSYIDGSPPVSEPSNGEQSASNWIASLNIFHAAEMMAIPAVAGAWTLRFGMFGWAERDMRGGVIKIEADGSMFGGDSNLVYRGSAAVSASGLVGSLAIDRHGADPEFRNSFGTDETHYEMAFNVEPISSDRLEGYMQRPGYPDMHLSMLRLQ